MSQSKKVEMTDSGLSVPNNVRIPFIEGDGIGADIWAAASNVFDSAVIKAYNGEKSIEWVEVLAGEKAFNNNGEWLPILRTASITSPTTALVVGSRPAPAPWNNTFPERLPSTSTALYTPSTLASMCSAGTNAG